MGTMSRLCLVLVLIWGWGGSLAAEQTSRSMVYIEDSPAAQELFDEVQSLRRQDRLADAAERLQRVVERYPHRLIPVDDNGGYEDALLQAHRKLLDDGSLREAYRNRYTATAQRRLDAALTPSPDGAALEQVAHRYNMTEPGLEAGLLLAGYYLARADGRSAASVLDHFNHHPDLPHHRARYDYLQAVAGLIGHERDRLHHHRDALLEDANKDAVAELEALARQLHPPLRLKPANQATVDVGDLPELLRRPLWQTDVRFAGDPSEGRAPRRLPHGPAAAPRRDTPSQHPPVLPTAGEHRLYVNEGDQLRALDRNSGWTAWRFAWEPPHAADASFTQFGRMASGGNEAQPVLLHGGFAFAVMGHSAFWPARWQDDTAPTALVAVNRDTGQLIWKVEPLELDSSFERANFQGTLIAGNDALFALVRRSQASGFQDTFLVAIDHRDGSLRWRRHLSSAATTSRYALGPRPEMSAYGSTIYVSDNIGTVAAVDTRSGTLRWARLFEAEQSTIERGILRGEVGNSDRIAGVPIRTAAGLVVPSPAMEGRKTLVLDTQTGRVLDAMSQGPWADADHLLPVDGDVLAIGREVVLFDGSTLEPRWSHRLAEGQAFTVAGRAAVSQRYVLVPIDEQVVMLRRDNGAFVRRIDMDEPGNVLVFDGQLVVASENSIRSYLDWRRAADHLRDQASEKPNDPGPGLALAHLALRADQTPVVLEGVDRALAVLQSPTLRRQSAEHRQRQEEVFARLHELIEVTDAGAAELRDNLFNRMATITTGPSQETTYHLSAASHYANTGETAKAVDHLQTVLLDRTLSAQLYERPQVARQAGLEAKRRLTALVDREGRDIYTPFETQAQRQFENLLERAGRADLLVRLADQYPLSTVAPQALREAGRRYAAADEMVLASRQFQRAYEQAQQEATALLPEIVGELAELYEQRGRPQQAAAWLERVRQRHPDLEPIRAGEPTSFNRWLDALATREQGAGDRPQLHLPLQSPRLLAGRPLSPPADSPDAQATDRLLTVDAGMVRLYLTSSDDQTLWQRELPNEPITALSVTAEQVLLWLEDSMALVALDGETGEPMWQPAEVADVLRQADTPQPRQRREAVAMPGDQQVRLAIDDQRLVRRQQPANNAETMFHRLSEQVVVVADAHGRMVGIDRNSGRTKWTRSASMDAVAAVAASGETIALAGVSGLGTDTISSVLLVLDMYTGEPRFPTVEDDTPPQWVGFAGDNLLAVATSEQVTAYQLGTGAVAWRLQVNSIPLSGRGWADEHLLLLQDNAGMAIVIEAGSGQWLNRISVFEGGSTSQIRTDAVAPNWQILTPTNLTAVDERGRVAWRDAVDLPRKQFVHAMAAREHTVVLHRESLDRTGMANQRNAPVIIQADGARVIVEADVEAAEGDDAKRRYRLFVMDRRTGRLVAERSLGPLPKQLEDGPAVLLDNQIAFSLGDQTLVIPGSTNREADDENDHVN